jgi:CDP-ribitol ribitolphosphotransferase
MLRIRIQFIKVAYRLGRLLPLRRHVVFALTHADHLSGNLEFIRAELDRRTPPIPYVILANRYDQTWRAWFGLFIQNLRAGYHLATAKVFIVDDYYFPLYVVPRRPGTTSIQTWHASGAFKKIGWSVLDKSFGADESLVARVTIHSNYDVCLMASKGAAVHYAEAFRQPLEKFRTDIGMPRTDVLFGDGKTERIRASVRQRYRLPSGKKVILYAPTFRGDNVRKATSPTDLELQLLHRELGGDHEVLLKLHPFVRDAHPIPPELRDFAIDASDHPDIHELMLASDILLTDYSSAIFEFSLLTKPMLFYIPDLASYEGERGFYIRVPEDLPGPVFETTAELAASLRAGVFDLERVARFRDDSFEVADGHASERFVDELVVPALHRSNPG